MNDVLVLAESHDGQFKKAAFEVVTFGRKLADQLGAKCHALVLGSVEGAGELGKYGAHAVHHGGADGFDKFDGRDYTTAIAAAADALQAGTVIIPHSLNDPRTIGDKIGCRVRLRCQSTH